MTTSRGLLALPVFAFAWFAVIGFWVGEALAWNSKKCVGTIPVPYCTSADNCYNSGVLCTVVVSPLNVCVDAALHHCYRGRCSGLDEDGLACGCDSPQGTCNP